MKYSIGNIVNNIVITVYSVRQVLEMLRETLMDKDKRERLRVGGGGGWVRERNAL